MLEYWPVWAFAFSMFIGSISVAIGATMWLAGKLAEQDAKRIELKESILEEVRKTREVIFNKLEEQRKAFDGKSAELERELRKADIKLTRLDTIVSSREWPPRS